MQIGFRSVALGVCSSFIVGGLAWAQQAAAPATKLNRERMEEFLKNAKIVSRRGISIGVTNSLRAKLSDGSVDHDAHIQSIDMAKSQYQTDRGTELNFRDSWKFNIAAYRIDKLLELNMIPVSIERRVPGIGQAAVTWWVDDVLMDEVTRYKKKIEPPEIENWNRQMYVVRIFDQLIYNVDRNLQNLVITKDWHVWMIDHTRAFRLFTALKEPQALVRCDRKLLDSLRRLDSQALRSEVRDYLTKPEIDGVLARRDRIVKFFEDQIARRGEAAVVFDFARH
ncbi:MAG: hypothetical protein WD696_12750 [Bryobacteraceae bacterium]